MENEEKCLRALKRMTAPMGEMCVPFRPIMRSTRLPRKVVRRHIRSLARKGLAEYYKGLWSLTDQMAGAGYCITKAGLATLS